MSERERIDAALVRVADLWPEGIDAVPGSYEVALKRDADTIRAALRESGALADERRVRRLLAEALKDYGIRTEEGKCDCPACTLVFAALAESGALDQKGDA